MLDLSNLEKALRQFKKTLLFCEAEVDAEEIYAILPDFVNKTDFLLQQLKLAQ